MLDGEASVVDKTRRVFSGHLISAIKTKLDSSLPRQRDMEETKSKRAVRCRELDLTLRTHFILQSFADESGKSKMPRIVR